MFHQKIPEQILTPLILTAFLALVLLASSFWHALPQLQPAFYSAQLVSYDKIASGDQACYTLLLAPHYFSNEREIAIQTRVNGQALDSGSLKLWQEADEKKVCFDSALLSQEKNRVEVLLENISLHFHSQLGEKTVKAEFPLVQARQKISGLVFPSFIFLVGLLVVFLSLFVFFAFVFSQKTGLEKTALSLAGLAFQALLESGLLALFQALNSINLLVLHLLVLAALALIFRKNFRLSFLEKININFLIAFAFLVLILLSAFLHFFSASHFTYWNVFYERQTEAIMLAQTLPLTDSLSYLGRASSFTPGYSFLEAWFGFMFGFQGQALFALMLGLSNLLLLLACLYFGQSLGFSRKKSAMIFFFLLSSIFILSNFIFSPRHTLSLSLLLIALAFFIKSRQQWSKLVFPGLMLGLTAFIQMPVFFASLLFYPLIARKIEARKFLSAFAFGALVFLALFSPIIWQSGLPYAVRAEEWGYLITAKTVNVLLENALLFLFFLAFFALDVLRRRIEGNFYCWKLLAGIILGAGIMVFFTFRWNVFLSLTLAVFLVELLPEKVFVCKYFSRCLALVFFLYLSALLALGAVAPAQGQIIDAWHYLETRTPAEAKVLADPILGHGVAFAGRAVLADLAIEYADEQKLADAYIFLNEKDYSLLEKYGINYVLNFSHFLYEKATDFTPKPKELQFEELEKIYANDLVAVHYSGFLD